jgi:signal transduction histidine kinase
MMPPDKDLTLPGLLHDLNNVFQTMVDAADLLSGDLRWRHLSSAILRSVERGQRLTASLESGRGASASIEDLVAHAISFVEDSTVAAGNKFALEFTCDLEPGIELRRAWAWERVLINLFINSRRAMTEGGSIHVRAKRTEGWIEIAVRDQGSGIAPELLDTLFEPHVSGSSSSGLGLHIVATIVGQDGGSVRAFNVPDGRGAEFVITLPASAAVAIRPPVSKELASVSGA